MPLYIYTVKDKSGKTITGRMNMENPQNVAAKLKEMEYVIVNILEEIPSVFSLDIGRKFIRIKLMDKINFYIKLVSMLKAGVSLVSSLESVKEQVSSKKFQNIIGDIHRNILSGNSLSQSLSLYPRVFPELLINVVQSGETSGRLIEVLDQYVIFSENQVAMRQKIKSALLYPFILIMAASGLLFIFMTYLLPKFVDLFRKTNIPLPFATQVLVNIGGFFGGRRALIFSGLILIIIFYFIFKRFILGKILIDSFKLNIPYIGILIKKVSIARFTRTLGTLYISGVPIIKSLEICEKSTGNIIFGRAIHVIKEAVTKGKSFAKTMGENKLFPKDTVQLIDIGESSGRLSDMLYKVAEFYERDVEYAVKNTSSLIEPVIILLVGLIVGFLAYSIIMPIFNMMSAL